MNFFPINLGVHKKLVKSDWRAPYKQRIGNVADIYMTLVAYAASPPKLVDFF